MRRARSERPLDERRREAKKRLSDFRDIESTVESTHAMFFVAFWSLSAVVALTSSAAVDPVSYLKPIKAKPHNVSQIWSSFKPSEKADKIRATSPDIWKVLPTTLDSKYRNPCWTDSSSSDRFRCAPYFQIIGVSKCGTTDLFARLKKHPELADGSKGPHWWDECPHPPRGACTAPPNGDFDGYVNLFEKGAYQIKTNPLMITGEASSNTFTGVFTFVRGLAVRRKIEGVNLAELIHEAQPYQKLIILMREPVSRYYSAFHYYRRSSKAPFESPERFHEKAVEDIKRWNACVEKLGSMACLKRYDPQQLIKGMYSEFVEAWRAVFPPEQVLWLRNEDYQAAPKEHIRAVLDFLGMSQLSEAEEQRMTLAPRSNSQSTKYPKMLPETKKMLEEFYAPFNQKLAKLLGDDRYLWLDS